MFLYLAGTYSQKRFPLDNLNPHIRELCER